MILSQILTTSKQYINQLKTKPSKRIDIIQQIILSPHYQSWIYLDSIIHSLILEQHNYQLKLILKQSIEYNYRNVKSFSMMIFIYNIQFQNQLSINIPFSSWATLYYDFCVKDSQLTIFNSWIINPQNNQKIIPLIQSTLQMVSKHFQPFLNQNKISFTDLQFNSIIQWILRMKTQSPQKFQLAHNLSTIIKDINIIKHQKDYITKQPLVIKKLFEYIGQPISDSGNAFLLLQPEDKFNQSTIQYFCHIQDYYLTDLNQQYLKNSFINLTLSGVTLPILTIIGKISSLLANNQQYFKLRHIYQHFILPHFTKFKTNTYFSRQIYDKVQFYVIGFLRHCNIGKNGIQYLLQDIQNIQNKQIQNLWITMALAVGISNSLEDYVRNILKQKGLQIKKQNNQLQIDSTKVWNVTLRTGKKYKKYIKNETKDYKGVQNRHNQCYIISVVQSLYFTQQLKKLLDSYRDNIKNKQLLLDQLRILFSQLSGKRDITTTIKISYLKKLGPVQFRQSQNQQDSMQYLIQLFQMIQSQCSKLPNMLNKFNQIFKIDCQHTTKCSNCNKQTTNIQNSYVHTIPHTQLLQLKIQQKQLQDYKCQNCKQKGYCKNIRQINPKCKIFIVHINRFSMKNGVCKKQLSNQTILRRFLNYELVGMICHCGKNINSGHYKYFAKDNKNNKQWIQLSDKNVLKFMLDQSDQEFQRQMQTDMAPYILFYRRID